MIYRGQAEVTTRLEHDANQALSATTGTFTGDLTVDTNTLHVDAANNRVGIGTASPASAALHIDSGSDNANTLMLSDGAADGNIVDGFVTSRHHSVSEEPVLMIQGRSTSSENIVLIGGTHNNSTYNTATSIKFFTASGYTNTTPVEKMRVTGDGLTFNGDTAAANALDDYEVGTWTAVLGAASVSPTYTAGNSTGHYVKVGDIVHFTWYSSSITFTSTGTGNGHISGLPYTAANGTEEYWVFRYEHGTAIRNTTGGYIVKNADRMFFTQDDNTAGNTWYSSGGYIMVSGSYRAA